MPALCLPTQWPTRASEAIAVQQALRGGVIRDDDYGVIRAVAGVDVGFEAGGRLARASVVVLTYPGLLLMDWAVARLPVAFPYVPGLLSFRELPVILEAIAQLHVFPDVILCDGQGVAHPRRFGIACHLGVLTGIPCIGVGKSRLIGTYDEPADRVGSSRALMDRGEEIGRVLRTRPGCRPLYISIGHRVGLASAVRLTRACVTRYRLPETTRWAHHIASNLKDG